MDTVINFKNVTKTYKLYKSDKHKFVGHFIKRIPYKNKTANKNITFKVNKGETLAILGKNGAGKSTLLKLITGVTAQTKGKIQIKEKVSALLELSTGFELDFTGRENIYLKGSLLGIDKNRMKEIEKNIVDFADIGEYIDQPMRTYSSGMRARLGFAICISIDPEILIVDEALAVGDKSFRKKCLIKVREIINKDHVTFILVTHSIKTAKDFCNRGIVLKKGEMIFDGTIDEAIEKYDKI